MIAAMTPQDAVSLTRTLLRCDTVNPPGRERDCARYAGAMLEEGGYAVEYFDFEEGRTPFKKKKKESKSIKKQI